MIFYPSSIHPISTKMLLKVHHRVCLSNTYWIRQISETTADMFHREGENQKLRVTLHHGKQGQVVHNTVLLW